MTTERPLPIPPSPSPSPSKYTFPSPIRNDPNLKPNPHPYAVKTTTSGLLTRSNSSSHNADTARHYYVPLSPKASRSPESDRGHKASKSLNNLAESPTRSSPRPLPVPPGHLHSQSAGSFGVFEDEYVSPRRNKRADTLPSFGSTEEVQLLTIPEDLPSNPKTWAPAQLSTYLVMALRVTDHSRSESAGLPIRVAKDIAAFAKSRMITGRMFLRLSEAELESMGMNRKWREALLAASHELRQNVLKGRIWGPEVSPTPSPGSTSPLPPAPFSSSLYNSSSSSLELSADEAEGEAHVRHPRRYRSGRVRGMVETFERSGSFSSEGGIDDEGTDERSKLGRWLREKGPIEEQPIRSPSPVTRGFSPERHAFRDETEEPSIEALLAAGSPDVPPTGTWGARAWEEMDLVPGETVKRLPNPEVSTGPNEIEAHQTIIAHGNGSGKKSGGRRDREERRVVTAIFTPAQPNCADNVAERTEAAVATDFETREEGAQTEASFGRYDADDADRASRLQAELAATRALIDAFRLRLEIVEQKVAELELLEAGREHGSVAGTGETQAIEASLLLEQAHRDDCRPSSPVPPGGSTFLSQTSALLPVALRRFTGSSANTSTDDGEDE